MGTIVIKRIYEPAEASDGFRVLVDRLWPRGVSKQRADLNLWLKEIAPSTDLRKWFGHDPAKWDQFVKKYEAELADNKEVVTQLVSIVEENPTVTLLYAAKDETHNEAVVLKEYLQGS